MPKESIIFLLSVLISYDTLIVSRPPVVAAPPPRFIPYDNPVPSLQAFALIKAAGTTDQNSILGLPEKLQQAVTALKESMHESNLNAWTQSTQTTMLDNYRITEALLFATKDPSQKDLIIRHMLKCATYNNKVSTLDFFIDKKVPVDTKIAWTQDTILHIAIRIGNTDLVHFLLNQDADINSRRCDQGTPLHTAVKSEKPEIAQLLLEKSADTQAQDTLGCRPWDLLKDASAFFDKKKRLTMMRLFSEYMPQQTNIDSQVLAKKEEEFITQASVGNIEALHRFLRENANINAQDEQGNTALMLAARNGYVKTVKFLLQNHANPAVVNNLRQDARSLALGTGEIAIAQLLNFAYSPSLHERRGICYDDPPLRPYYCTHSRPRTE